MTRYIGRRLIQMVITFLIFQVLLFLMLELQPGDFADRFLGNPQLTQEARESLIQDFGLDKPPLQRGLIYITNFWQGDLGVSFSEYPRQVGDIIAERLPRTVFLFLTATIISFWFGFVSGKWLAWNRGTLAEYSATVTGVVLYTVFTPWFALMMIFIFAYSLDLFPLGKFLSPRLWLRAPFEGNQVFITMLISTFVLCFGFAVVFIATRNMSPVQRRRIRIPANLAVVGAFAVYWLVIQGPIWSPNLDQTMLYYAWDIFTHLVLPVLTVTLVSFAGTMLLMRNSMLETLSEDYIMTARAKGLPSRMIRDKHAARNALLPVVTSLVYGIAFAINGGIITETIFSWPGLGLTILNAAVEQDIPLAMGTLLIIGAVALIAHLIADILYAYLDPRIRY